jgi:hypothetical protein
MPGPLPQHCGYGHSNFRGAAQKRVKRHRRPSLRLSFVRAKAARACRAHVWQWLNATTGCSASWSPILDINQNGALQRAIECSLNPLHVPYLQHILNHAISGIKIMPRNIKPICINVLRKSIHKFHPSAPTSAPLNGCLMLRQRDDYSPAGDARGSFWISAAIHFRRME